MWLDLTRRTESKQLFKPQLVAADVTDAAAVDMHKSPEEAVVLVNVGTITDGAYQLEIHHSDASDGTFVALTDENGNAVKSEVFDSTNDDKVSVIAIKNYKRFVKAIVKETVAGVTGGIIGATVQGVLKVAG